MSTSFWHTLEQGDRWVAQSVRQLTRSFGMPKRQREGAIVVAQVRCLQKIINDPVGTTGVRSGMRAGVRDLVRIGSWSIDKHEARDDAVRVLGVHSLPLEIQPAEALDVRAEGGV
jgi:hypothetical protein